MNKFEIKSGPGVKSKVMISGYDNELYRDILSGWITFSTRTEAEKGLSRTETVWLNYDVGLFGVTA